MPNVDGKQFGYGPKGKKAAKKYAKKHGLKVKHKDNPGYYAESKTEMNSYDRILEMLGRGTPSSSAPGHSKRMKDHMKRIQGHPEFEEDKAAKNRGKKGADASNKAQAERKK
jgi:hypothetical protein